MLLPPFLLVLAFTSRSVHSVYTTISSVDDLMGFAEEVNAGTTYRGSTVTLTTDLDLSGVEYPGIGAYSNPSPNYFRGTFSGNGHVISNMILSSSDRTYLGFFAVVNGGDINGIVIDSSCSVTNSVTYYNYASGVIGYATSGIELKISDCVNMASITGTGDKTNLGGIVGSLYAFDYAATVYNCVNLGTITQLGTASSSTAGGIIGWLSSKNVTEAVSAVYNCANLGTVTSGSSSVGAIVGLTEKSQQSVQNNYWLSGTASKAYYKTANASNNEEFSSDYTLLSGGPLVDALNNYVDSQSSYDLRKWGAVTFDTDGGSAVSSMISMWVLLGTPDAPTKDGLVFYGWYTDSALQTIWNASVQFNGDSTLYARWVMNQYSVVFDFGNGTTIEEIVRFNKTIDYPADPEMMEGYTFIGWDKNITNMPPENITITAVWKANNYTVTFDFGNGTTIEKIIPFNETITYPKNLVMEGHAFNRWDKNITNMPAENITITAVWKETPTEYVEIVFNKKDMTEDEVHKIISKYVPNDNYVIKIVESENGETKVIIKFNDASEAEEFIESVELSIKDDSAINNLIKRITPFDEKDDGFSLPTSILSFYFYLFITL